MMIHVLRQGGAESASAWLVLLVFEDLADFPDGLRATPLGALLQRLIAEKELTGSVGDLLAVHGLAGFAAGSILIVGLGAREKFDSAASFKAGLTLGKRLAGKPRDQVALALPAGVDLWSSQWVSALIEGVVVGTRGPGIRKTEADRHPFGTLNVLVGPGESEEDTRRVEQQVRRGEIVAEAVNLARDLANTPPAEKYPSRLAEQIRLAASDAGIAVQVWDETRIRQERFGGLLGVAAGSANPPAFVVLDHRQGGETPPLALVGKGVTFDSGGLSLKPTASMEDMKSDMTGAAVVAATMQAVARLNLKVNIVGYLALTENMTGGRAMKLGDVLTLRNGKTVEVLNTDAEGRLILADALAFAAENKPARILDLATLTGACMVALGSKVAGLLSNNDDFSEQVLGICRQTGERAWRLPLDDDYKELLKSNVADLKNVGGKWGGAITAAKFLEQFVDSTPWVHLDIAGPSWNDSDNASGDVGATGCFVRTLVALFEKEGSETS
ncbi:MAG: leucyl aminopeptidase [Isosphaeraceae bacterium]